MTRLISLTVILLAILSTSPLLAQQINLQGRLATPEGEVVPDGSNDLIVRLYENASGGIPVWTETHAVETTGGLFSVMLGSVTPFDGLDFENPYYITLNVNGSSEIGPPTEFGVVPYAVSAGRLSESALAAGSNVTITKEDDGQLRIDAAGGDTGGLVSVTTDNTLSGNGTGGSPLSLANNSVTNDKLADGAVSTPKLGDGSVTGQKLANQSVTPAKLADNAVVAGSNVTVNRNGNGSFEVSASGGTSFSLPYFGTSNSSQPAIRVGNQGSGTGIEINGTGGTGLAVANTGFAGVAIANAGEEGVRINSAGRRGIWIVQSSQEGLRIDKSNSHGVSVLDAAATGVQIVKAAGNGIQIDQAGTNGVQVGTTQFDGIQVQNASRDGLRVSKAGNHGARISNTNLDGVAALNIGRDGLHVEQAGRYGIFVTGGQQGAARFEGDVTVTGTLSKGGGSFKIDHPLDPENKYLSHSFVESPDMMNVYNGNVVTDENGEATVILPDYFEALNRDFRYQLTAIGTFAQAMVSEKIAGNRFAIRTNKPNVEVSWQVTGIRQDKWANENRIVVEEDKLHDGLRP